MKSSLFKITLICSITLFSSFTQSAPVTFSFQSTLQFDSTLGVATGGQTVGDVFDAIYGAGTGAAGQVAITGSLTYDDSTPVFQQIVVSNGNGQSNFLAPITGLQLTIGGTPVNANIVSINANNASSALGVGMDVASAFPDTCLGYLADCAADFPGLAMTQTSNTAFISDNTLSTGNARDTIIFGLGLTGIDNDFSPGLDTGALGLGNVFVDGFFLTLQGKPSTQLWSSHTTLPGSNLPYDPANFDIASVGLLFNGSSINEFAASGTLSAVPIPATIWLFGSGLLGLIGIARRKKV